MDKSNFTKREWIFTIIIISLIQGVIWYISYLHSNNYNALSYVSFSGTLISIILAVLAIGYTYGESVSEKNKSDNISTQISLLSEVIKNVDIQTKSLTKIEDISNDLSGIAERLEDGFAKTRDEVVTVSKTLEALINENVSKSSQTIYPNDLDKTEVAKNFLSARTPLLEISILFIISVHNKVYDHNSEMISNSVGKIIDEIIDENKEKNNLYLENMKKLFTGSVLSVTNILQGLGLLKNESMEEDSIKYVVCKELVDELKETTLLYPQIAGTTYTKIRDKLIRDTAQIINERDSFA